MSKLGRNEFYKIANVKQHSEFEKYLKDILFKPEERTHFYHELLNVNSNVFVDTFKQYFEEYSAERKSNMQDYTPDSVAGMLATLTRSDPKKSSGWSGYDPTAGTGSLLIQKWKDDCLTENPLFTYVPHNYLYMAEEMADNVIPYLLHNLALRGMNCVVIHGNTLERNVKQIYFVQNSADDFLGFSDINVMPHNETIKEEFDVASWDEEAIDYHESEIVDLKLTPMEIAKKQIGSGIQRKPFETDVSKPSLPYDANSEKEQLRLNDVAKVERAKSKKVYPAGTIVIQMSATRGQIGLLTSNGEVGSQYACVMTFLGEPRFMFYMLKMKAPKWFNRVQEGLNLKLQDIEKIPVTLTFADRETLYEQMSLDLGDEKNDNQK